MEIFVWIEMGGDVDDIELNFIMSEGDSENGGTRDETEKSRFFEERFAEFDVALAQCYDPVQKDLLLATIGTHSALAPFVRYVPSLLTCVLSAIPEAGFGGLGNFNQALKATMTALRHKQDSRRAA